MLCFANGRSGRDDLDFRNNDTNLHQEFYILRQDGCARTNGLVKLMFLLLHALCIDRVLARFRDQCTRRGAPTGSFSHSHGA